MFPLLFSCLLRLLPSSIVLNYLKPSLKEQELTKHALWSQFHWTWFQNQPKQRMLLSKGQWILPARTFEEHNLLVLQVSQVTGVDRFVLTLFIYSHTPQPEPQSFLFHFARDSSIFAMEKEVYVPS